MKSGGGGARAIQRNATFYGDSSSHKLDVSRHTSLGRSKQMPKRQQQLHQLIKSPPAEENFASPMSNEVMKSIYNYDGT